MGSKKACEHYWLPFKTDCEELLGRFQQTETVRYEEFLAIWREMDFSSVFNGTPSDHEKRAFTRLSFTIVCNYFLPPYSFQTRAGSLYMIYGLYNTQHVWPKEKIRVALKDWLHVEKFITEAKSCRHLDVVYVFHTLVSDKAFYYTAMPKKLTFEASERVQHDVNEEFRGRRDRVAELASAELLEEIANVHGHYEKMKSAFLPPSAGVTLLSLTGALEKCVSDYQQWQNDIAAAKDKEAKRRKGSQKSESSNRAEMLAAIKSKSYGHLSKGKSRSSEIVTTSLEGDQTRKKKPQSLRARTYQNLGKPGEEEQTQQWLLSIMEEDKNALKRKGHKRFKWSERK